MPDDSSSSRPDDLIGKELGQYTITRKLGRGGMASVYLADQESIGRQVAVKVMPRHFLHDPNFLERFQREVKVIANLQHPRVLPVYDYGQIDERPYIVMAFMPGGTLADQIEKGGMTLKQTAKIIRQVSEGLDHAHRKGIIHRDFKPSNVLMSEYGDAVLADFGIAKMNEATVNLTGSGVIGTPSYMAPEMAERGEVTPAVDIYALGVTLYEMLTGRVPFQGETPLSVMMAHATRPVPDLLLNRPDVPAAVADVIKRAMAKRPEDRFRTAAEMAKALDVAVSGVKSTGTSPKPPPAQTMQMSQAGASPVGVTVPEPADSSAAGAIGSQSVAAPDAFQQETSTTKRSGLLRVFGGLGLGALALIFLCVVIAIVGGVLLAVVPTVEVTATPAAVSGDGGELIEGNSVFEAELFVVNNSGHDICAVYFRQPGTELDDWSDNMLGGTETVTVGQELYAGPIPSGTHWFRAEFCGGNLFNGYDFDVTVSEGQAYDFVVEGTGDTTLTIINESPLEVCFLFAVPPGDQLRGDHFGQFQSLPSGQRLDLGFPTGTYDFQASTCNQDITWDLPNTTISATFEWTLTQ